MMKIILLNIIFLFILLNSFSQKINNSVIWFYENDFKNQYTFNIPVIIEENNIVILESISQRDYVKSIYESQIGIREKGINSGKEVEMYLASAGLSKGNPWCASFVQWSYLQCDSGLKIKSAGWVPSWFPSKKLIYVRGKINKEHPRSGDLIGIYFKEKKRLAHIGFYDSETSDFYITVEGNTNEEGSREGDGVYKKRRLKGQVHSISSWLNN